MRHLAVPNPAGATVVQKVRFYSYNTSNVFGAGSNIDAEWVY